MRPARDSLRQEPAGSRAGLAPMPVTPERGAMDFHRREKPVGSRGGLGEPRPGWDPQQQTRRREGLTRCKAGSSPVTTQIHLTVRVCVLAELFPDVPQNPASNPADRAPRFPEPLQHRELRQSPASRCSAAFPLSANDHSSF